MGTTNYTGTATNHTTITIPDDAEYASAGIAAVNTPLEELKDITEYLEASVFRGYETVYLRSYISGSAWGGYYGTSSAHDWIALTDGSDPAITPAAADVELGDIIRVEAVFSASLTSSAAEVKAVLYYDALDVDVPGALCRIQVGGGGADYPVYHLLGEFVMDADASVVAFLAVRNIASPGTLNILEPIVLRMTVFRART